MTEVPLYITDCGLECNQTKIEFRYLQNDKNESYRKLEESLFSSRIETLFPPSRIFRERF